MTYPDNPHYTAPDVSAHGKWDKGSCSNDTAHVTVGLYEYYTDGYFYLKVKGPSTQLKPRKVSNNRANARTRCDSTSRDITWLNMVDVDVDGEIDSGEKGTNKNNVYCVVN